MSIYFLIYIRKNRIKSLILVQYNNNKSMYCTKL